MKKRVLVRTLQLQKTVPVEQARKWQNTLLAELIYYAGIHRLTWTNTWGTVAAQVGDGSAIVTGNIEIIRLGRWPKTEEVYHNMWEDITEDRGARRLISYEGPPFRDLGPVSRVRLPHNEKRLEGLAFNA